MGKFIGKIYCKMQHFLSAKGVTSTNNGHLTSPFGSNLADFDEIFAPKWSCKDLLIESIKLLTHPIHDIVYHPLKFWSFFSCIIMQSLLHLLLINYLFIKSFKIRYSLGVYLIYLDFSGLLRPLFSIHHLLKLSLFL